MAKIKTTQTAENVSDFLNNIEDKNKRSDALALVDLMQEETGFKPRMWGPSIIGFGSYHYKYASGHEGEAPLTGFSPRAKEFSLYLSRNFKDKEVLLKNLGKYRAAVACIYIKHLSDINQQVLRQMIRASVADIKATYPEN
ncbi:DUF1801 domain-containing protein [Mucilaginibacter litoreus]|uniref:DUF1801 domain-containing protein n=1 Tax=Mucilaginibacter litoreus TaxID=1048221 RepID=A0ABW3ARL1_9SPHI